MWVRVTVRVWVWVRVEASVELVSAGRTMEAERQASGWVRCGRERKHDRGCGEQGDAVSPAHLRQGAPHARVYGTVCDAPCAPRAHKVSNAPDATVVSESP